MEYKCEICNKLYLSYQSLWNHNNKFHKLMTSERLQMTSERLQMTSNDFTKSLIQNKYICEYCNNSFTRKNNLNYHIKNKCKEKERIDEEKELLKQQIEKLSNDLEKLKKKSTKKIINYNTYSNNTLNNNSNNNNSNNLTNINNIGKEKISELSHDEMRYIMSYGMDSVISLTEHLNFNEKLPYNHNFYVSAINDKHLNTFDMKTQTIVKQRKKDIFDQILVAHIDKLEKINKNINYKNFDNVLTKLRNAIELKKDKKYYISKLNMLAYNKRNLIIKTWEELINDDSITPEEITTTFQKRVHEITKDPLNIRNNNDSESDSNSDINSDSDSDSD